MKNLVDVTCDVWTHIAISCDGFSNQYIKIYVRDLERSTIERIVDIFREMGEKNSQFAWMKSAYFNEEHMELFIGYHQGQIASIHRYMVWSEGFPYTAIVSSVFDSKTHTLYVPTETTCPIVQFEI